MSADPLSHPPTLDQQDRQTSKCLDCGYEFPTWLHRLWCIKCAGSNVKTLYDIRTEKEESHEPNDPRR